MYVGFGNCELQGVFAVETDVVKVYSSSGMRYDYDYDVALYWLFLSVAHPIARWREILYVAGLTRHEDRDITQAKNDLRYGLIIQTRFIITLFVWFGVFVFWLWRLNQRAPEFLKLPSQGRCILQITSFIIHRNKMQPIIILNLLSYFLSIQTCQTAKVCFWNRIWSNIFILFTCTSKCHKV